MRVKNLHNCRTRVNSNTAAIASKLESSDIYASDTDGQRQENNNHPRNVCVKPTQRHRYNTECITIVIKQSACKQLFCFFHFRAYFFMRCSVCRRFHFCTAVAKFFSSQLLYFGRIKSVFVFIAMSSSSASMHLLCDIITSHSTLWASYK